MLKAVIVLLATKARGGSTYVGLTISHIWQEALKAGMTGVELTTPESQI